jgi:hypothetical protein
MSGRCHTEIPRLLPDGIFPFVPYAVRFAIAAEAAAKGQSRFAVMSNMA